MAKIDKEKLEKALLDYGLSVNRARSLALYLKDKDLMEVTKAKPAINRKTINEVVKED